MISFQVVWLSPSERGGFTDLYILESRDVSWQAARFTVVSGEKGFWVVWYDSDMVRLRTKGGKTALPGFKYVLGLSVYGGGH